MSKDGGPAFPVPSEVIPLGDHMSYVQHAHGMSLRDYFAAAAMHGVLANPGSIGGKKVDSESQIAQSCYLIADAMLRARAEGEAQS